MPQEPIRQTDIFRTFMNYIWSEATTAEYDRFHNANDVATAMGARRIAVTKLDGDDNDPSIGTDYSGFWLFHDKSGIELLIDGNGIEDEDDLDSPDIYDLKAKAKSKTVMP